MPRASSEGPLTAVRDGVHLAVRVTPRARADRLDGIAATADGGVALKVLVTAPPSDNRANAAVLRLLAREWRLRQSDLDIVVGAASRNKTVRIVGDAETLIARLSAAIAALPSA